MCLKFHLFVITQLLRKNKSESTQLNSTSHGSVAFQQHTNRPTIDCWDFTLFLSNQISESRTKHSIIGRYVASERLINSLAKPFSSDIWSEKSRRSWTCSRLAITRMSAKLKWNCEWSRKILSACLLSSYSKRYKVYIFFFFLPTRSAQLATRNDFSLVRLHQHNSLCVQCRRVWIDCHRQDNFGIKRASLCVQEKEKNRQTLWKRASLMRKVCNVD